MISGSVVLSSVIFYSCQDEKPTEADTSTMEEAASAENIEDVEKEDKFKGIHGLPSPIQIASTIKRSGSNYDVSVLNSMENVSKYTTNYQKSLNVGVYGADLGYAAIYDQKQDAISYLNTVKTLADELGIIGAFERNTLEEVQNNLGDQDKLLDIVTNAFFESDQYLQEHKRNKASALILTGGWIEGLYLAAEMEKNDHYGEIKIRIGEQKITLNILVALLKQFENDAEITDLLQKIEELKSIFDTVEIEYVYPTEEDTIVTDKENKSTEINVHSIVHISDEQVEQIRNKIEALRTQIIS